MTKMKPIIADGECYINEAIFKDSECISTLDVDESNGDSEVVELPSSTNGPYEQSLLHIASISGDKEFDDRLDTHTGVRTNAGVDPEALLASRTNFLSASHGARVLFATDEWFATADNLLNESDPVFDPDAFCEQGKVMDGWETRRRREIGHDWCVLKLSERASIGVVCLDTAYFTGNHVPRISIQVADLMDSFDEVTMISEFPGAITRLLYGGIQGTGATPNEVIQAEKACSSVRWWELLPMTPLQPGYDESRMHYFRVGECTGTHVRVNFFPDGGLARLRLFGTVAPAKLQVSRRPRYSPIATGRACSVVHHGINREQVFSNQQHYPELSLDGISIKCSNQHYGIPSNLLQSTLGHDMGDGWETARHPDRPSILVKDKETGLVDSDLSDWCILQLGHPAASVKAVILDTKYFLGNYPESVQVEGCFCSFKEIIIEENDAVEWFPLVPRERMTPDAEHLFDASKMYDGDKTQVRNSDRAVSHVRVSIYPDGGLSRVRVYGVPLEESN